MSNDSVISKINRYIQRLLIEYKKQDITLFNILKELENSDIKIKTHNEVEECFDNLANSYLETYYAHKLVFLLPKECFENSISISNQETISEKIKQDLNQIISESDEYISEVKFELKNEIDVNAYLNGKIMNTKTPGFWEKDCLRTFVSHSDKNYSFAKKLKDQFMDSGISCFVAHKDIEPTKKWQEEIIKALKSAELVLVLITEDFNKSWWTNQEVGFALGRDIPIISIKLDQNPPPGFIYETQAIALNETDISPRSTGYLKLLKLIKSKFPKHPVFKKNLLKKFFDARSISLARAKETFMDLISLKFDDQEIEKIAEEITDKTEKPGRFGGLNQLQAILMDHIGSDHLKRISDKHEFYGELLRDKILSQHTQKRYSVMKLSEPKYGNVFEIIDNHKTISKKQKSDIDNIENLPF